VTRQTKEIKVLILKPNCNVERLIKQATQSVTWELSW